MEINKIKQLKLYIKDNGKKSTIIFVHGFGSDASFAKEIYQLEANYNIVGINFLKFASYLNYSEIKFDILVKCLENVIDNIKGLKYIFAHSLGAAITLFAKNLDEIEKIFFLAPLHPFVTKSNFFKILKKTHNFNDLKLEKTSLMFQKVVSLYSKKQSLISEVINPQSIWKNIVNEVILNDFFLTNLLSRKYQIYKDKIEFFIGKNDFLVDTYLFQAYLKTLHLDSNVIGYGHNPIKDNASLFNTFLNSNVKNKNRWQGALFKKDFL